MIRTLIHWLHRFRWALVGLLGLALLGYWKCLPDTLFKDPSSTVIYDRNGQLMGARIAADGQWRFPFNDEVPEKFRECLVQFEDRQFFDHPGFSIRGFARAAKQNASSRRVVSGGSTITMQVIRLSRKGKGRTVWEKIIELIQATRLEWSVSKSEILAFWASNAPFGGNVVGLDAASWRYYGRPPERLSWAESATLAVLPNAPSLIYPGKNQKRLLAKRNRLLNRLLEVGLLDSLGHKLACIEPLPQAPHPLPGLAPHLLERFHAGSNSGKRLSTTLDLNLQEQVKQTMEFHQERLRDNQIFNAAALVIAVKTGEVLAYVGNVDQTKAEHGGAVDIIHAPRSTGSILKPFLYAGMLESGKITPDQLVADVPTQIGSYSPKNFTMSYDGAVPASRALARSLNVPAVRMLRKYGVERFHLQMRQMGMSTLTNGPDHYGLSLILGGAEATLWDLAALYAQMARTLNQYPHYGENVMAPSRLLLPENEAPVAEHAGYPVIGAGAVWQTFKAMVEVARPEEDAHWQTFGSSRKVAWKTGTSFGFRDAWAIGVTPEHVVAVWVGNADGEGRPGLVGVKAAAPVLFNLFDHLPASGWFSEPYDDMEQVSICSESGYRASAICSHAEKRWIPKSSLNTRACPFHRWVHLDGSGTQQVTGACEPVGTMRHEAWFVLPPTMEWYYRFNNPRYQTLPPFREGCRAENHEQTMSIIYPKKPSRIYVPLQLDGTRSKTVFEITHRKQGGTVHWHLNNEYLGATTDIHQMELEPPAGRHILTLVDEWGNSLSQSFEVLEKGGA